jgi:L-lactate dehydrogenase (cytochrome)/(S)-mandelate dehydrogenase
LGQLAVTPEPGETTSLLQRARNAGYRVLVVTVDVPVIGNREEERRQGSARQGSNLRQRGLVLTPRRALNVARHPRWAYGVLRHRRASMRNLVAGGSVGAGIDSVEILHREIDRSRMTWDDLAWIREQWPGTVWAKGILEVEVLMDGGIRRGSDVVKALALGARAVLIGRAYLWGMAANGEAGVVNVIEILRAGITETLDALGVASIHDLSPDHVVMPPGFVLDRGRS